MTNGLSAATKTSQRKSKTLETIRGRSLPFAEFEIVDRNRTESGRRCATSSNRTGLVQRFRRQFMSYPYTSPSYSSSILQQMYESPELHNEGLLSFEYPLFKATDQELDQFLGHLISNVGKAAGGVVKAAGNVAGGALKTVGKAVSAVDKVVPMSLVTAGLSFTPLGLAARAGLGAAQASAEGRNVFQGAMHSLAGDPVTRFYVDTATGVARGDKVFKAAQQAMQAGVKDLRESLRFAAMVAPFIPGIGTGVAAALGAANALAAGQPITDALIAAARDAIPGGAIAQTAFDVATGVLKGKKITDALLEAARSRLPGGPVAQAAFDAGLALAKGRNIQEAAFAAAGHILPPSPYAADALAFVKRVASGENLQKAALSQAGKMVLGKIEQQVGPVVSQVASRSVKLPQWGTKIVPNVASLKRSSPIARAAVLGARTIPGFVRNKAIPERKLVLPGVGFPSRRPVSLGVAAKLGAPLKHFDFRTAALGAQAAPESTPRKLPIESTVETRITPIAASGNFQLNGPAQYTDTERTAVALPTYLRFRQEDVRWPAMAVRSTGRWVRRNNHIVLLGIL